MPEETEIAFDLFSTSYVRVPKVTEQERREAEEKQLAAEFRMLGISPADISWMLDLQKAVYHPFVYGSPAREAERLEGLAKPIRWVDDEFYPSIYKFDYKEPDLGPAPAAKPDQPRQWVARNQAPKRFRK